MAALLLAPSLVAFSSASAAASKGKWHIIVMPYLAQDAPIDIRGYVGVFLYSYGFLEAVIDLNHNGVPDPGEPVINITAKDRLVYASIGYGMAYKNYYRVRHGDGPLWILVRRPVVASFIAYSARNGYVAAYTMPPPGKFFVTPGIPGNLYIAPTTPGKTSINITYPDGSVKHYVVDSDQYLLVNNKENQVLRIKSDKPVAVVLVNLNYDNNASYATELVPLEKDWILKMVSPPFPESLITKTLATIGFSDTRSYLYTVGLNGTVSVEEYKSPTLIKLDDKSLGAAYVLVEARRGKNYAADIVPVYNMANWWHVLGGGESTSLMVSFSLYTGYHGRVSLIDAVANKASSTTWIIADYNRDFQGDIALASRVHSSTGDHLFLVAPRGKRLNINLYSSNAGIQVYSIVASMSKGSLLARLIGVPIPAEAPGGYKPRDTYLEKYGPRSVKNLAPSMTSIGLSSIGTGYSLISRNEVKVYATITPSNGNCTSYQVGVLLLGSDTTRIASRLQQGCKTELRASILGMASPVMYAGSLVIKDSKVFLYPGYSILVGGLTEQLPGNVSPVYKPVYIRPGVYTARLSITRAYSYYSVSPIRMPSVEKLLETLWLTSPSATSTPITTPQTTTQSPAITTRTKTTTTMPSKPGATTTTARKPAKTTKTPASAATTAMKETQPLVRNGDTITYTVTVSGSGPAGSASGSGEVELKAVLKGNRLGLRVEKNTLGRTAASLLLLVNPVSDLFLVAASAQTGKTLYYTLPSYNPPTAAKCPVIKPGMDSRTISGEFKMMYNYKYKCTYSKGVLVSAEAEVSGSVASKSFNVKAKACLKDTSIAGVEKPKEESKGLPTLVLAVAGAAVIVVVVGILLAMKRKG